MYNKKTILIILLFIFFIFLLSFNNTAFGKYILNFDLQAANINIDRCPPEIELLDIENSNLNYEHYANKTHDINFKFKITEKNILKNNFNSNYIKFYLDNKIISPKNFEITLFSQNNNELLYDIKISGIDGNGILKINILEGAIIDSSNLNFDNKVFDTGILIDNVPPITIFKETLLSSGKSLANFNCNEKVRALNGWNLSDNKMVLSKEFSNIIEYPIPITDYAQNTSYSNVSIKTASYISLNYGTYDASDNNINLQEAGNIAGYNTITNNLIYKTEALMVHYKDYLDSTLLQGRAYLYMHFGKGSTDNCKYSELPYSYGYNPSNSDWISMSSSALHLAYIQGKLCMQFRRSRYECW